MSSYVTSGFRVHEGRSFLDSVGFNRQVIGTQIRDTANSVVSYTGDALQDNWNDGYSGFQKAGLALSSLASGAIVTGALTHLAIAQHNGIRSMIGNAMAEVPLLRKWGLAAEHSHIDAVRHNGRIFAKMDNGGFGELGKRKSILRNIESETAAAEAAFAKGAKGVTKGIWRTAGVGEEALSAGRFIRTSRLMSPLGLAAIIGATFLVPMLTDTAASIAGRFMDEAHLAYNQSMHHTYDTREFNNRAMQSWEFSKQNQIQSNLMPYEQNNMSLARIYYSR